MSQKSPSLYSIVSILAVIGIILASYLTYEFFAPKPLGFCSISSTINCDPVTKGNLSTFLGIPVSIVGLTGYVVILVSSLLKNKKLILGMSTFGLLFCIRLLVLEIFVEKVYCVVCIACMIVMTAIFAIALKMRKQVESSEATE